MSFNDDWRYGSYDDDEDDDYEDDPDDDDRW